MPARERPNLLFILSDQHSPYVAGCYGDPLSPTPHIDSLAERGATFDAVYCPSPLCVPSRMAFLTGQYPYQNQVWTNDHILDTGIPTYAHAMGAGGYRPVLIGRMHSLGPDQLRGYAERLVGDHSSNYPGGKHVHRGKLEGTAGPERISLINSGCGQSGYQVHDEYVTAATIDYLNRIGIERRCGQQTEPFCLTVGFMLPHQPFVAQREDYDRYQDKMTMPDHPEPYSDRLHPYYKWWRQTTGIEDVSAEEILRARTAYWALVSRMDAMIGQILDALHANGLADNTLIIYTSDHGEQVGEHGLWWKQTFYEASVRVPLVMCWPGVIPPGTRCPRVANLLDVNATMLAALDAPTLPNSNGRNLLDLITSPAMSDGWNDEAFSEFCLDEGWYMRMVRSGDWKLNYYHGHAPQLFNLAEDPSELHDRADDPACADIRQALTEKILRDWHPDEIAQIMERKRADAALMKEWVRAIDPPEQYRWDLRPEMNYLDDE